MVQAADFVVERTAVSTIPLRLAWPRLPEPLLAALTSVLGLLTRALPNLLGYQLLLVARRT
jgi:hypothetical protein